VDCNYPVSIKQIHSLQPVQVCKPFISTRHLNMPTLNRVGMAPRLTMLPLSDSPQPLAPGRGLAFGLVGVLGFSLTLPATRLATASLDPMLVGCGRGLGGALLAAPMLYLASERLPSLSQVRRLTIVALGVVFGFPLLSAWAMKQAPASHGAVVLGLLPLATALAAAFRAHERPSIAFWCASTIGSAAVVAYALATGGGRFQPADLALIAAVALGALGYAEGGMLAREIGAWQVIAWALALSFPLLLVPVAITVHADGLMAPPAAWAAMAYLSIVSAFLGFIAWYRGLALGGVARVGQVQLLQPFFTLMFSAAFLGESITPPAVAAMSCVALSILLGRSSKITLASADRTTTEA
jgi:drug/metabolite transporter (DMT)-like permease